jgi:hypothetical protein
MTPTKLFAFAFWRLRVAFPNGDRYAEWKAYVVLGLAEMCALLSICFLISDWFRLRLPAGGFWLKVIFFFIGLFLMIGNRWLIRRGGHWNSWQREFETYSARTRIWGSVATFTIIALLIASALVTAEQVRRGSH